MSHMSHIINDDSLFGMTFWQIGVLTGDLRVNILKAELQVEPTKMAQLDFYIYMLHVTYM